MDTREKIIAPQRAEALLKQSVAEGKPFRLIAGYFDPLLAGHMEAVARHAQPGGLVVVAVLTPPEPLLPAASRAELAAAISGVDYVFVAGEAPGDELPGWCSALPRHLVADLRAEDLSRRQALIDRIVSRCASSRRGGSNHGG